MNWMRGIEERVINHPSIISSVISSDVGWNTLFVPFVVEYDERKGEWVGFVNFSSEI
jgi:hypothetical protein